MNLIEIHNWTDDRLIQEAKGLHSCIEVSKCFSWRDVQLYHWVVTELEKRGYELSEGALEITKTDED